MSINFALKMHSLIENDTFSSFWLVFESEQTYLTHTYMSLHDLLLFIVRRVGEFQKTIVDRQYIGRQYSWINLIALFKWTHAWPSIQFNTDFTCKSYFIFSAWKAGQFCKWIVIIKLTQWTWKVHQNVIVRLKKKTEISVHLYEPSFPTRRL